jgi:hypothetical protein
MMKNRIWVMVAAMLSTFSISAMAAGGSPSSAAARTSGRFFGGGVSVNPTNLNDEGRANGIKKVSTTLLLGAEISYAVLDWMELGLRYGRNQADRDEDPSDPNHDYKIYITQDILQATMRIPLAKSDMFRADIFGSYGGAATTFKLESASQSGEMSGGLFKTPVSSAGISMGIGHGGFYLYLEAGSFFDKADGLKRSGNINNSLQTVDLSGPYALVGFMLTGGGLSMASRK